jgi:hypothetical protein
MSDPKPDSAGALLTEDGIELHISFNSGFAVKIPITPDEADKLARELAEAYMQWKRRHS